MEYLQKTRKNKKQRSKRSKRFTKKMSGGGRLADEANNNWFISLLINCLQDTWIHHPRWGEVKKRAQDRESMEHASDQEKMNYGLPGAGLTYDQTDYISALSAIDRAGRRINTPIGHGTFTVATYHPPHRPPSDDLLFVPGVKSNPFFNELRKGRDGTWERGPGERAHSRNFHRRTGTHPDTGVGALNHIHFYDTRQGAKVGFPHGGQNSFLVVPNGGNKVHINVVLQGLAQWTPERGFPPELRKCIVLGLPAVVEAEDLTTNPGISPASRNFLDEILTRDELLNFLGRLNINPQTNLVRVEEAEEEGAEEEGQGEEDEDAAAAQGQGEEDEDAAAARAQARAEAEQEEAARRKRDLHNLLNNWLRAKKDELNGRRGAAARTRTARAAITASGYSSREIRDAVNTLRAQNPASWTRTHSANRWADPIQFTGGRRRLYKTKKNTRKSKRKKHHRKQRKTRRA
jgi:hypothetical protein